MSLLKPMLALLCFITIVGCSGKYSYLNKAHSLFDRGLYKESSFYYTKLINNDESEAKNYYYRGLSFLMLEDFDKAIFDFSKAIELDSGYANAYINRGSILKEKGEFKKALLDYNVVVKLNPDDLKALEERADLLFVDEAYQNAIEDYDELISKSYEKPSVYRKRADAKYFNFNYRGAIQDYSKSILLNPLDSYAYNNLAWLLATCPDRKFRDGNEAVYNSIKAVKLDDNKYNLHTLSAAYAALGKYDQSVLVMNRILKNYVWDDKELIVLKGHLEEFKANRSLWKLPGE